MSIPIVVCIGRYFHEFIVIHRDWNCSACILSTDRRDIDLRIGRKILLVDPGKTEKTIMLENNSYYNISYDIMGTPSIETTTTKIFLSLQSQVLNSFLYSQILFLVIVLLAIELTNKHACSWENFFNPSMNKTSKYIKILRTLCFIALPLAIYGVLLCISIKMGLNL
jgi:hypothetical protein